MVDGCGTLGSMDEELCARWMQIAAFMPMMRLYHNSTHLDRQGFRKSTTAFEFWNFKNDTYKESIKSSIRLRMMYVRQIFSDLYESYFFDQALV